MARMRQHGWTFSVLQDWVDATSGVPSIDPNWTFTDAAGHPHSYDGGYRTLRHVIDSQHFCDGTEGIYNHDPHWAVDESHYECLICDTVIEPGTIAPYTPQSIPGMRSYTATGPVGGFTVEFAMSPEEFEAVMGVDDPSPIMEQLVDANPDRVLRMSSQGWR